MQNKKITYIKIYCTVYSTVYTVQCTCMAFSCWMLMREHAEHLLKIIRGLVLPKLLERNCKGRGLFCWTISERNCAITSPAEHIPLYNLKKNVWFSLSFPVRNNPSEDLLVGTLPAELLLNTSGMQGLSDYILNKKVLAEHSLKATCSFEHLLKETDPTKILFNWTTPERKVLLNIF